MEIDNEEQHVVNDDPERLELIRAKMQHMSERLGIHIQISRNNHRFIVVKGKKYDFYLTYISRVDKWGVAFPYPANYKNQTRYRFTENKTIDFLKDNGADINENI